MAATTRTPKAAAAAEVAAAPDTGPAANGKVPAAAPAAPLGKVMLDPDKLSMGDMTRAREKLGVNPWEKLAGHPEDRDTLIIWCVRSRDDPGYTWEQAAAVPFSELEPAEEPPLPLTDAPSSSGTPPDGPTGAPS